MEDLREPKSDNPEAKDGKRRQSFLSSWLRRRFGQPPETERQIEHNDDEEEDDTETPAHKRFRQGWRRLFGRIMPAPKPQATGENSQPVLAEKPGAPLPESTAGPLAAAPERQVSPDQKLKQTTAEDQPSAETSPSDKRRRPERSKPDETKERVVRIPHEPEAAAADSEPLSAPIERLAPPAAPPPLEYAIIERNAADNPATSTAEHVRVIERPNRLAAAVGVGLVAENILRRHADRNIRRDLGKEQAKLDEQAKQSQERIAKLEQQAPEQVREMAKQAAERQHDMAVWQQAFEAPGAPKLARALEAAGPANTAAKERSRRSPEAKPLPATERQLAKSKERQAANQSSRNPEKASSKSTKESLVQPAENLSKSAAALEKQIQTAAEQDAPLEALYERSHEIKDEAAAAHATAIAVAAKQRQAGHAAMSSLPPTTPVTPKSATNSRHSAVPQPYKQAAQSGFYAAVVLLAITVMIALIA